MLKRVSFIFLFLLCLSLSGAFAHLKITDIVKLIKPAVVTINTYDEKGDPIGQGTGFFVAKNQIISSRHVFEGAMSAKIKTSGGVIYSITAVIADDDKWDIILLSTEPLNERIEPLLISNKYPQEGQKIVVIGSPRGFEQTVSDGIISSIRDIPNTGKIIQITAPISPGSSGSPVVDLLGEVIGIATLQMHHAQQLNFAVSGEHILEMGTGGSKTLAQWSAENAKDNLQNNVFEDIKLGYKIEYPFDWIYEKPTQYKRVFSGKEGTDAYYSMVALQNVASKKIGGNYTDISSIMKDFKKQILTHGENAKFYGEKKFVYSTKNGIILMGEEFVCEYVKSGENFKQWQIFIPRQGNEIYYVWVYSSPADQYDNYIDIAKMMLKSWEIK